MAEDAFSDGGVLSRGRIDDIEDVIMDSDEVELQGLDEEDLCSTHTKPQKRGREEEESAAWVEVKKRKDRMKEKSHQIEVIVTSTETFPKQFALAKLLKNQNISNITKLKYIHPYKISVEFSNEESADEFNCQYFRDLGWRFQRPYEVNLSYGVIKNIELGLTEKELMESITVNDGEVLNVKRLKRRTNGEAGWTDSESVRVGFIGPHLPPHLYIFELKVNIEPYVFPVTQCSRCWRFGHHHKTCSSKRIYCPKCGGKHENCETTIFKCINCTNSHMALNKQCPEYLKEKKIREIMSEFNVSYRKAKTMYVPPEYPLRSDSKSNTNHTPTHTYTNPIELNTTVMQQTPTYVSIASTPKTPSSNLHEENSKDKRNRNINKKKKTTNIQSSEKDTRTENEQSSDSDNNDRPNFGQKGKKNKRTRIDLSFTQLLQQIKDIIFLNNEPMKDKFRNVVLMILDWLTSCVMNYIPNLPVLLNIFKYHYGED